MLILCNLRPMHPAVHGDLRTTNAMLGKKEDSGDRKLLFIDFEWAGREGQTWYPPNLNMTQFNNGAASGAGITRAHDLCMLDLWD